MFLSTTRVSLSLQKGPETLHELPITAQLGGWGEEWKYFHLKAGAFCKESGLSDLSQLLGALMLKEKSDDSGRREFGAQRDRASELMP